nr:unnamed protein product [Callosobruchus chinensis]
MEPVEKRAC